MAGTLQPRCKTNEGRDVQEFSVRDTPVGDIIKLINNNKIINNKMGEGGGKDPNMTTAKTLVLVLFNSFYFLTLACTHKTNNKLNGRMSICSSVKLRK
jgi:hypothetical protein